MRFAYLIQSEAALPPHFDALRANSHRRLFHLTFKEAVPGAIHLPESTWTQGRNRLLAEARASAEAFDYFIFSDDDVQFLSGSWDAFERHLDRHRPPIGLPTFPLSTHHDRAFSAYDFDAIVNAFHRDIIADEIILPYIETYDSQSWWLSQYFVIHLAGALYPRGVMKFPDLVIDNLQHREYPRISVDQFSDFDEAYFSLWLDEPWARAHFRPHFTTRDDPPFPTVTAQSYRLSAELRGRLRTRASAVGA
jgi:hypothetical protein